MRRLGHGQLFHIGIFTNTPLCTCTGDSIPLWRRSGARATGLSVNATEGRDAVLWEMIREFPENKDYCGSATETSRAARACATAASIAPRSTGSPGTPVGTT